MAVSTTNAISGPYTTNGSTTVFPFTFTTPSTREVAVVLVDGDGVETVVSSGSYTVTLGTDGGGSVEFDTAPASGYDLYVQLDPEFTQDIEFEDGSGWLAAPVNLGNDRAAARDQYLKARVDKLVPDGLLTGAGAGQFLAYDASGNPIFSTGTGADAGLRTDLAAPTGAALVGFIQSGTGAVTRTALDKMQDIVSASDFGADPNATDSYNAGAIQAAIDSRDDIGGGSVLVDRIYRHSDTLTMRNGVYLRGFGKYASGLTYTGSTLQIDGRGADTDNRKIFSLSDMSLAWAGSGVAECMKLAWNQRSVPITFGLRISAFPGAAIHYTGDNWLIAHLFDEILACGTDSTVGSAIIRDTAINLADIKFLGCFIEACGHTSMTGGGGVNMIGDGAHTTQGLWMVDCTIEGNKGTHEAYFDYADSVNIASSYIETETGTGKHGIGFSHAYATVDQTRIASASANTGGRAIVAKNNSVVEVSKNVYDSDFADCDLYLDSSLGSGSDFSGLMRVKKTGTGEWISPNTYAAGIVNGTGQAVVSGVNLGTVVKNSTGNYTVNFTRPLPSTNYTVAVTPRDSGSGVLFGAFQASGTSSFIVYVVNAAGVATDADYIGLTVIGSLV